MEFLHAIPSQMPGMGNVRTESRRGQVICSTPKRNTTVRRSRLSQISRSSLRFSGPRSPGISPVSGRTSLAVDNFSDIDDFEEASIRRESPQRPTRIHGNRSRGMEQFETFQTKVLDVEMKRAVPRWGVSQSQKKVQYEPLGVVIDEEEYTGMGKRGPKKKTQVKQHGGISSAGYRNSVRGSDSEYESLDSGKGASEAQVSIPAAISSGAGVLENGSRLQAGVPNHKNLSQRRTSVSKFLKHDSGMEEIQELPKGRIVDLISSAQWKSSRTCYEPLVLANSDEEDNDVGKKKKGNRKKISTKKCNANNMRTGTKGRLKEIVVSASFDDYEDDEEEDFEEEREQNSWDEPEDEYVDGVHRRREEQRRDYSSGEASYESVRSHEANRPGEVSPRICNEIDEAEDVLNESFYSDEDEVLSGSVVFNQNGYRRGREGQFYNQERYPSVVRKPLYRESHIGYDDEEEDKFEEGSVEYCTDLDVSGPCRDSSDRILSDQEDVYSDEEIQELLNTSGPGNGHLNMLYSQSLARSSERRAIKGKPGRRRTVSQSSQTDAEENLVEESGKKARKAPQKKKQPSQDDKEGGVKRKRGTPSSEKPGEGDPKPKKRGRKKKSESQESSDNSPTEKTSDVEGPTAKKTRRRNNKSVAASDTLQEKPNSRKRKSDDCDPSIPTEKAKKGRTPKARKIEKEESESNVAPSEEGSKDVVKKKRGRPCKSSPTATKGKKQRGKNTDQQKSEDDSKADAAVDSEEKAMLCDDIAGKRRSLHNPNVSQGLSLKNEESSSSDKSDSQNPLPLSPRIVRKKSAESSSDYLRKKVLTMRLGKSICYQSLMEREEQLITSTPVKPVSSRIALSSSTKEPDAEIVFFGDAAKDVSQPTVKESLEMRISEESVKDSEKDEAVKNVGEDKVNEINEEPKNENESENTSSNVKDAEESPAKEDKISKNVTESSSEGKENAETSANKKPKTPSKSSEKFVVSKILSEWPADEICATSNEKLMKAPPKPNKVKTLVNGKEQEIEAFVEYSQIKFHKHKKQNIQYGPAVNAPSFGSGLVHLTPGSDKGFSVAKQCNFVYVVLGGLVAVTIFNETERLCRPGDFIVIPKGAKYNIAGRGDKVSALVYFKCQGTETI